MIRRRLDKQVGAYRDGALSEGQADAVRRRLESDPEARTELARYESLGRLTREAWREGPTAPPAELLISALRPGMARIDAELQEQRSSRRRGWFVPVPVLAMGAAAALVAAVLLRPAALPDPLGASGAPGFAARAENPAPLPVQPIADAAQSDPQELPVYELAQGDAPLVVFEDGGTTFIWLLEEPKRGGDDDLSSITIAHGGWV
jgi:anti-sigma factor RsiW